MATGSISALLQAIAANSAATKTAIEGLSRRLDASWTPTSMAAGPTPQTNIADALKQIVINTGKAVKKEEADRGTKLTEGLGKLTKSLGDLGEGARKATLSTTVPGALAGGFQQMGAIAGAVPGPGGAIAKGVFDLAGGLADFVDNMRKMRRELLNVNIQQGEFSGAMKAVEERQKARDVLMSIQRGDALAESAERLAQSQTLAEQARMTAEVEKEKIKNELAFEANVREAYLAAHPEKKFLGLPLTDVTEEAKKWFKEKQDQFGKSIAEDLDSFVEPNWATKYGVPPRFNP